MPELDGPRRPPRRAPMPGSGSSRARARTAARPTLDLAGRVGDLVSLLPIGADAEGVTTHGLRLPARATSRCSSGRTRGLSNVRERAGRRRRRCGAASCSSSRPLLRSDHGPADRRRPGTRGRPARRDGHDPRPRRPARPLDRPVLLPEGRHARLHGRGVRVPRRERDDHRARRRRLGHQPAGRGQQARLQREVRPAVHAARRRGPRRRRGLRHLGREAELRQDVLGHGPDDVPDRPGRPHRARLAQGQARGPRRGRPGRPRRAADAARHEPRAPAERTSRGFARGGRRAKPRSEAYAEARALATRSRTRMRRR